MRPEKIIHSLEMERPIDKHDILVSLSLKCINNMNISIMKNTREESRIKSKLHTIETVLMLEEEVENRSHQRRKKKSSLLKISPIELFLEIDGRRKDLSRANTCHDIIDGDVHISHTS